MDTKQVINGGSVSSRLRVAIIAPPWLSLYDNCFFGIENMVHNLATGLADRGHHVELFTVGSSTTRDAKLHWLHENEQYQHMRQPYHNNVSIIIAHVLFALRTIKERGGIDIIHDHNNFIGPAMMAYLDNSLPPVLHTLHHPLTEEELIRQGIPDIRLLFEQLPATTSLRLNPISEKQASMAPSNLHPLMTSVIHNGINLADYTFSKNKKDFFLNVGSIKVNKGQDIAARLCHELDEPLKIAGVIAESITTPTQLRQQLKRPLKQVLQNANFKYFVDKVKPYLVPNRIEYIGAVKGKRKSDLFSQAKAFLLPIQWEEPFGIVALEALASGTPVVAMAYGAMPEIIEHGKNGFLANNESEFKYYMQKVDQIDPSECRNSVKAKFSAEVMARQYENVYRELIGGLA